MKQLLFLLLFPCFALAQYQGNANQKITLGEQTTADGLVWRGIRADTTSKIVPFSDTSAYIILDTVEKTLWLYKAGQIPKWQQVGGSTLDTATMLLPYYRAGRNTIIQAADVPTLNQNTTGSAATLTTGRTIQTNLASTSAATFNGSANITPGVTGTLPVANGGTGSATQNFVDLTTTQSIGGAKTFTSAVTATRFNPTFSTETGTGMFLPATNTLGFSTNGVERVRINSIGNVGYGTNNPVSLLHIQKALGTIVAAADQLRVSSGVRGDRAGIHLTDNITSDAFISFLPDSIAAIRILELTCNGAGGGISVDGNGRLGVGTTSPAVQFHTTGAVRFATFAGGGTTTLDVDNTGNLARTSSIELKKDVTPINYGLNQILKINPINFNWINEDKYGNENENGFIAEDVMNVIPNVVGSDAHGLFMDYTKLIPILTKAIQEQQALIKALEQRIINLENK